MLRLIFVGLFLILFGIASIFVMPFLWLYGKINSQKKDFIALRFVQGVFRIILFICGVKTDVTGIENIPADEPVLFIGNHRGIFDVIISYCYMPNLTGYIAKNSIEKVPVLRTYMRHLHCLFLNRDNPKEGLKTILKGIEQIKGGISMVIFPEGTRNKGEGILDFHGGSFKLAEKSHCKIVPMVQNKTEYIFENQFPRIRRTKTTLEFGKPIDLSELSDEDKRGIARYTQNIVEQMYEKMTNNTLV